MGDLVREGQEVATIARYLGETLHRVKSPMEGRVLVVITSLAVVEGGLLLGLGPEQAELRLRLTRRVQPGILRPVRAAIRSSWFAFKLEDPAPY